MRVPTDRAGPNPQDNPAYIIYPEREQGGYAVTMIQLPDEQAAALAAKAAAQGLTLADWLAKLAATETPVGPARPRKGRYSLAELMAECDSNAALTAEDRAWLDAPAVGREAL